MKWFQLALNFIPVVETILRAGGQSKAADLMTPIATAVSDAQKIHGDANGDAKRQVVLDAAKIASVTGVVQIPEDKALAITNCVLQSIDNIHQVVKLNAPVQAVPTSPGTIQ